MMLFVQQHFTTLLTDVRTSVLGGGYNVPEGIQIVRYTDTKLSMKLEAGQLIPVAS
jgi:hypothetical protein